MFLVKTKIFPDAPFIEVERMTIFSILKQISVESSISNIPGRKAGTHFPKEQVYK